MSEHKLKLEKKVRDAARNRFSQAKAIKLPPDHSHLVIGKSGNKAKRSKNSAG